MLRVLFASAVALNVGAAEISIVAESNPLTDATHELVWPTLRWETYTVEFADDAGGPWIALTTAIKGDGTLFRYSFGIHVDSRLFRVRSQSTQQPAPDLESFSLIPAGTFTMGSPPWEPGRSRLDMETQRKVTIKKAFNIAQYETTHAESAKVFNWGIDNGMLVAADNTIRTRDDRFQRLLRQQPGLEFTGDFSRLKPPRKSESQVATEMTWHGAMVYCFLLNTIEDREQAINWDTWGVRIHAKGYRPPTEAEWEYACRAGTQTAFYTGPITQTGSWPIDPNLDKAGIYRANEHLHAELPVVGVKAPNDWGLFDMHGNVPEWCIDKFISVDLGDLIDPIGLSDRTETHTLRGGGRDDEAHNCRAAARFGSSNFSGGLRIVIVSDEP